MPYYRPCPHCGAKLDPGEPCEDCRETKEKGALPATKQVEHLFNHSPKRIMTELYHESLRSSRKRSNS